MTYYYKYGIIYYLVKERNYMKNFLINKIIEVNDIAYGKGTSTPQIIKELNTYNTQLLYNVLMYSILDSEYYSKIDKTTTKENQTFLVKLIITDYLTINNEERKKAFLKVEQGLNLELLELIQFKSHDGEFLALMSKDVLDNEDLLDEFGYCKEDIEVII